MSLALVRAKGWASRALHHGVVRPTFARPVTNRGRSASTEISTTLLRAVGLVKPRKNLAGNTIANDNAIALAA